MFNQHLIHYLHLFQFVTEYSRWELFEINPSQKQQRAEQQNNNKLVGVVQKACGHLNE